MQIHELPFLSTGGGITDDSLLVVSKSEKTYKYAWSAAKSVMQTVANAAINAALAAEGAIASAISAAQNDSFIMKNYTASYTCTPGNAVGVTANDFGFATPSGYTPIAVYNLQTRSNYIVFRSLNVAATGSTNALILVNVSSSQTATTTADLGVLYAKTAML